MKKILGAIALCAIAYSIGKYSKSINVKLGIPIIAAAIAIMEAKKDN